MNRKSKQLSNSFSTGGGGGHFEAHVQASYVVLMLTGGCAPCLPCWPVTEIKLQGKVGGFDTDDLIVTVEKAGTKAQRKLLVQVKHSITITNSSTLFGEVIQAAWNDFNNSKVFAKGKDKIALITGPLSATDEHNVQWLLNQARCTKDADEFFRIVRQAKFSPSKSSEKLDVIEHHLKVANGGTKIPRECLYSFLRHFCLLDYDLGEESGVVLSLLHSHIAQFEPQGPRLVWSRVVDMVQTWNQNAGTITPANLPEDLLDNFKQKPVMEMPDEFKKVHEVQKTDWTHHSDATCLALAILIGSWSEQSERDKQTLTGLLGIDYNEWLQKAREILHLPDSPLSLKNGTWKVENRVELWNQLGSRILDNDLDTFKSLATIVLKESDPAFDLSPDERHAAGCYGKVLDHSGALRKGIAEGLAILGNHPTACIHCLQGKAEWTSILTIREIFSDSGWVLWGSLNRLLPVLAEAAPDECLKTVEGALQLTPCPFDELFAQESDYRNHLTGLFWALEGLAWDERYLVQVCMILGKLASRDPGGSWTNRPSNSLVTILLPWLPQTTAPIQKRKATMETLINELPDIGWNLLVQLLPNQYRTSSGSHKPAWRNTIPDDWEKRVTKEEYWEQSSFYAELAVSSAGHNFQRLSELIDRFNSLPRSAFDQLIEVLSSSDVSDLPETQRRLIWDRLTRFTNKHRRFPDAVWALPDELIAHIEGVSKELAPTDPFYLYHHLFSEPNVDLYDENSNWKEQQKKLDERRESAIKEIFRQGGIDHVIRFAQSVLSPSPVGRALSAITDHVIEQALLPQLLNSGDIKLESMVREYISKKHSTMSWNWSDEIVKSNWTPIQKGCFLACLPFDSGAWERADQWLGELQSEYWSRTNAFAHEEADDRLEIAIEKLIEHGRPYAAINCLHRMRHIGKPINTELCIRALLAVVSSSNEPSNSMDDHRIVELIKFLQSESSVDAEDLIKIEWAYVSLLDIPGETSPKLLESKLAGDPEFFCEVIRLIYRPEKDDQPLQAPSEEQVAMATNAQKLLEIWQTPPGLMEDGTFSPEHFRNWLQQVKTICLESDHLEAALIHVGEILIHAPADPSGLWVHRTIATALNDHDADLMRNGYSTGVYNSRGIHGVDPTGKLEKDLADKFLHKSDEVENAGFHRLANTLRTLADDYVKEAEYIVSEHQ